MEPLIKVRGLTKVYRTDGQQTPALRGVDLEIAPGEFTAVAGPSGSGKSTLLHLIGGLDHPTAGEVWLEGQRIDRLDHNRLAELRLRHFGFVFQAYNLIPVLTALENAAFVLELQGRPRREREERARRALGDLGIGELWNRRPNQLSGGQQQRVAVARALAARPRLILADEPTANLDGATGGALIDEMRRLNREHGVTFLVATHDPRLLERVRRIVHLEDGRVVRDETREAG
ncbi:MAG: ABC transporter ATP-binding protein [Armatimonadota bacterium]|nr:ABC transporter ATP-binding protein [Armatimonadota bacterium]MDR7495016.1 ABC transporter ATP-binding protein [Armatimonadota bacterium]MDR7505979.1 ABC transporter ATP-binding protein [Armatimonadota bacterium]MDR7559376.1 ABC transporter ATP-binding protein [Armatimonadota bacterium]MDR7573813.1 ABC transporter ATP-binding protein [Armatimonadota bacterium]